MAVIDLFSLKSYSRITSNKNFIPEIDGLRFIAIITVIFLHLSTNYKREYSQNIPIDFKDTLFSQILYASGWGVELFFTISGFILSIPFIKFARNKSENLDIKSYFLRRLIRLEPPFIISLIIIYLGNIFLSAYSFYDSFPHFLATLFYCHMFFFGTWSNINPITWSLETEVQFYILAPLLILIFKSNRKWIPRIIITILFIISYNFSGDRILNEYNLQKSIIPYFQSFAVGILIGDLYIQYTNWFKVRSVFADVIAWIGIPLIYMSKMYSNDLIFNLMILIYFISVFKSKSYKSFICNKLITTIGGMCYTIYLFHYALIFVLMKVFLKFQIQSVLNHVIIVSIACLFTIIVFSFLFFRFFERPFMNRNFFNTILSKSLNQK